jgi:integrase
MGRRETVIIKPHLNDCNGDLSQKWFVEWKWRIPGVPDIQRRRHYKGLNPPATAEERQAEADRVIKEVNDWFAKGEHLHGGTRIIYADQIQYRNEAKMYGDKKNGVITSRAYLSEFLSDVKFRVNKKSYESYQSKMRIFNSWLELNHLGEIAVSYITREHIIKFLIYLSEDRNLSIASVDKYQQILHVFFRFFEEKKVINENPVTRIPHRLGQEVDQAPLPIQSDDLARLSQLIQEEDQQLWLGCQIQYFCALRPGEELRLMKLQWIDFDRGLIRIPSTQAKNNKTQNVKIPTILIDEMKNVYQLHLIKNKDLYVFGKNGFPGPEHLGKNTMTNRFNKFRDRLKLSQQYKFYSWKHTGAIDASNQGMNPYDLKNHLRHSSLETTERYLQKRRGNEERDIDPFFKKI